MKDLSNAGVQSVLNFAGQWGKMSCRIPVNLLLMAGRGLKRFLLCLDGDVRVLDH
jgi:hypothetical protein